MHPADREVGTPKALFDIEGICRRQASVWHWPAGIRSREAILPGLLHLLAQCARLPGRKAEACSRSIRPRPLPRSTSSTIGTSVQGETVPRLNQDAGTACPRHGQRQELRVEGVDLDEGLGRVPGAAQWARMALEQL